MARTKTKAVAAPAPQDDAAAARQLGEIARARAQIKAHAESGIAKLQEEAAERDLPLKEREAALAAGLQNWAEANRQRLTGGGKVRTVKLATGVVAWRAGRKTVKVARGMAEAVEKALAAAKLKKFLRRTATLNKDAILADPSGVEKIEGLSVEAGPEEFVVEPAQLEGVAP